MIFELISSQVDRGPPGGVRVILRSQLPHEDGRPDPKWDNIFWLIGDFRSASHARTLIEHKGAYLNAAIALSGVPFGSKTLIS